MSGGVTACYCYAVTRPFREEELAGLRGVEGADVRQVVDDDLVAVVSPVAAEEFDEAALRRKLEDLDWLDRVARAHSAVVDALAATATTLPFRLATVYLDEDRARRVLRERRGGFTAALDRISGCAEWGVKVNTDPRQASVPPATTAAGDGSGRSYLRRRLAARHTRDDIWRQAVEAAQHIDRALTELAEARQQHRPQSAELSGRPGENVLNVAYLVAEARSEEFLARFAELRDATGGCHIELTGPWAPYSFATDEEPATGTGPGEPAARSEVAR